MSRTKSMLAIAAAATMFGSAAKAAVSPVGLTLVPHTTQGLADDVNLSNYCTYDLQVNITGTGSQVGSPGPGDRWISSDLRAILSTGTFYVPAKKNGISDNDKPQTDFWPSSTLHPAIEDDTFITSPGKGRSSDDPVNGWNPFDPVNNPSGPHSQYGFDVSSHFSLLGPATGLPGGTLASTATFPRTGNSKQTVDAAYGDTANASADYPDGVYTLARLTVTVGTNGTVIGDVSAKSDPTHPVQFSFNIGGGPTPEPTSVALLGIGLGAVALRRRK